ncbi:MAG: SpoIID/LytB domain-containing protein [Calditrichaceae bacterium]
MSSKFEFPVIQNKSIVNICLFKHMDAVDICFDDQNYIIKDNQGTILNNKISDTRTWRIKIKECETAVYSYFLIISESQNFELIQDEYQKLSKNCNPLLIEEAGGDVLYSGYQITNNRMFRLMAGPFESEKEARHYCKNIGQLNHCNIHRKMEKSGSGIIEIFDLDNDFYAEVKDSLQFIPVNSDEYFEIKHFELPLCGETDKVIRENLYYQGGFQIKIDENCALAGSNQIPLELYLKGVLASEIGDQHSEEFIKTMAIVIRSQVFANYGLKHFDEPYDFCSSSHCLRYYGIKPESDAITKAINQTNGLLLQDDGKVNPALFSYSCGGHTDSYDINSATLKGNNTITKFDCCEPKNFKYNLKTEKDAEKWIMQQPEVYCRETLEASMIDQKLATNSFRWEVFYTRIELEKILKEITGEDPGIIYEIIPLSRGSSGRIKEIEILGSLKNVRINGELNIRSAFSDSLLQSSCFVVKPELAEDGIPVSFTFIGAGNGHGIGLCKVGAAKMASENYSMENILKHYFQESQIQKRY